MLPKELTYLKVASKWVSWAGLGVSAYDIASNGLNFSNGLDAAMGGVSFAPYVGWIIGGAYFISNAVIVQTSGLSIGQHIEHTSRRLFGNGSWF